MKTFNNYNELKEKYNKLAIELLEVKGSGDWQNEDIYFHDNLTAFAQFEVSDGWYSDILYNTEIDFNGAPDLFDFIDYVSLGENLQSEWDDSCNYLSVDGHILTTGYGW